MNFINLLKWTIFNKNHCNCSWETCHLYFSVQVTY